MSIAKWLLAKKLGGGSPFPPVIKRVTGNPIEFSDGADAPLVKCVTQITGSQDLHGQDKPWVGGAGKNKFTIPGYSGSTYSNVSYTFDADTNTLSKSGTSSGSAGTNVGTISLANGTYTFSAVFEETGAGTSIYLRDVNTGTNVAFISNYTRQTTVQLDGDYYVRLATETGATSGSIKNIQLELGSQATAFAPYSNICPITAYTEGEIEVGNISKDSDYNFIDDKFIDANGIVSDNGLYKYCPEYIKVSPNTSYTAIMEKTSWAELGFTIPFYDGNKNFVHRVIAIPASQGGIGVKTGTFTTGDDVEYIRFSCPKDSINQKITGQKTTHTTTFPSAIYRGSEDVVRGEVTAEWKKIVFDGTENWQVSYQNGHYRYTNVAISDIKKPSANNVPVHAVTNIYQVRAADLTYMGYDGFSVQSGTSGVVYIYDSRFDAENKLADFKSALSQENLVVAYELATPTTSSVTPTNLPIKSLSGYNHIESSTGDMTIDYITEGYQNFVNTVESALPNTTRNLLTASKGGTKAMDIFLSLEKRDDKEEEVKEETKEDMR